METKKGRFKTNLDSFHQTSWNFVGISTVVRVAAFTEQAHNVVSTLFLGWILVMTLNNVEPTLFQRQIFNV
jgi:hypothetical protein